MKHYSLLALLFGLAFSHSALASCDQLNGIYEVQGQDDNGVEGPISGSWGKASIKFLSEDQTTCSYQVISKVKNFAVPFKTGSQTVIISKAQGMIGQDFTLKNTDGSVAGKGIYMLGTDHLTFEVEEGVCGSEGTQTTCSMDLFFTKVQ